MFAKGFRQSVVLLPFEVSPIISSVLSPALLYTFISLKLNPNPVLSPAGLQ
jgi:hypothetical protein